MNTRQFGFAAVAFTLYVTAGGADTVRAQTNRDIGTSVKTSVAGIRVLKVRENVYMLTGAGGNITVLTFADGVLLVDTGAAANADKVLAVVKELSDQQIAHIINTSANPDHVGGNEKLSLAGRRIPHDIIAADASGGAEGPMIFAHEKVVARMSAPTGAQPAAPVRAWPTDPYSIPFRKLSSHLRGGEQVQLFYAPAAHSDGDSIVWFRRSDIIMTGEIFTTTNYPVIDVDRGGTVNGVIDALNHILDVAFPFSRSEGGTMIIPGRGRLCDSSDVGYYRDMVTIIRDRVQTMINKGMTLEQVKAAKPTLDYDPRYAAQKGPWTTAMFVEAVYRTLVADKKSKK